MTIKLFFNLDFNYYYIVAGLKSSRSQVTSSQVTNWSKGTTLVITLTLFFRRDINKYTFYPILLLDF